MTDPLDGHYDDVIKTIIDGDLVPFLGAGANRCGRGPFQPGQNLPDGSELAEYLALEYRYPLADRKDLARVSQYVAIRRGTGPLFKKIRELLACEHQPTDLHRLLAAIPGLLRKAGHTTSQHQLIVTTNYDDLLERAFDQAAGGPQSYDVVAYFAEGKTRGNFHHRLSNGNWRSIDKPNEYLDVDPQKRTVILKVHGAMDRADARNDGFVVTEDHYIDYLTRTDVSTLMPVLVTEKLRESSFLFLGYSLRDWNLRVIFHRLWAERDRTYTSWAIQKEGDDFDRRLWDKRGVEIQYVDIKSYVGTLSTRLQAALAGDTPPGAASLCPGQ